MNSDENEKKKLRLYVAGTSTRSSTAISNVRGMCEQYFKGGFDLEVIDIYQQPELAEKENIIAAPTLVRSLPPPLRRIVGDMTDKDRVILVLDM